MSRNEINLDQIQQRLGGQNKARPSYDDYDNDAAKYNYDQSGSEGTTLNAGFIATIVAAFVAVGGGTYFFAGDGFSMPDLGLNWSWGGEEAQVAAASGSKLDSVCGKGWQAELPNVDQMHCYMTREVYRLCDDKEYAALLATVKQYDADYNVWHRKYMMATFKTIGKLQTHGMQLGMEAAKMENMKGSEKEQLDQLSKVTGIADNIMKPANEMLAQRVSKIPEYQLTNAATALVKKGYIAKKDFGRKMPDFMAAAFKAAGKVKTACPNRG